MASADGEVDHERAESFDIETQEDERERFGSVDAAENVWEEATCIVVESGPVSKKMLDFKVLWTYMGPGWLMSIAYLDPGNLEADLQAGAYAGYELLWVLFWCTAIGLLLQVLAARLGVVTGMNLAQMCRIEYGHKSWTVILLWLMTELAIIGSDIQEVIGGAIALNVLSSGKISLAVGTLIVATTTFVLLGLSKFGIRKVEAVFGFLILVMVIAFWGSMVIAKPDVGQILEGVFVPRVQDYAVQQAVGILGAVIMPHNIYLHSALVTSRVLDRKDKERVAESNKYNAIESGMALFVSFLINLAVVATFATSYFDPVCASSVDGNNTACVPLHGLDSRFSNCIEPDNIDTNVQCHPAFNRSWARTQKCTPQYTSANPTDPADAALDGFVCAQIGLDNAGPALENLFGTGSASSSVAKIIWGVGLLAAGQASTITGTYAGQFVMAGFLDFKIQAWQRMLVTRLVALGPAVAVAVLAAGHPTVTDVINEWLNVLQSVQLPFALLPVLHITSQRKYMQHFANGVALKAICWTLAMIVIAVNVYLVITSLDNPSAIVIVIVVVFFVAYFSFISVIVSSDIAQLRAFVFGTKTAADEVASPDDAAADTPYTSMKDPPTKSPPTPHTKM